MGKKEIIHSKRLEDTYVSLTAYDNTRQAYKQLGKGRPFGKGGKNWHVLNSFQSCSPSQLYYFSFAFSPSAKLAGRSA